MGWFDTTVLVVAALLTSGSVVAELLPGVVAGAGVARSQVVVRRRSASSVVHVATPLLSACVPQPVMSMPPFLNATLPVGVPDAEATVELRVTGPLKTEGFGDGAGLNVVVVAIPFDDLVDRVRRAGSEGRIAGVARRDRVRAGGQRGGRGGRGPGRPASASSQPVMVVTPSTNATVAGRCAGRGRDGCGEEDRVPGGGRVRARAEGGGDAARSMSWMSVARAREVGVAR